MATLAELIVKIGVSTNEFSKGMTKAEREAAKFAKKMQQLGSNITQIGTKLTTGLTLPIAGAMAASFKLASSMQDAMGAADQVFGKSSAAMQKWAKNLETSYGIASGEALEYANMMGSMLKNIGGLTESEAAKQAQTLIKLAGDLTAMYGGTTADAVRALTGALKGNNTMLDNYGMAVNDAMIKTKAMEMGLIKEKGEMDLATKQAATLALIMEQSGAAQGQAAREAEGASGSMRTFTTELKNLGTTIGENLLPVLTPMITQLSKLTKSFGDLDPNTKKVVLAVAGLVAVVGPLLMFIGQIITIAPALGAAFTIATGPIGVIVMAIAGLIAIGVLLYKNWDEIIKMLGIMMGNFKTGFILAWDAIKNGIKWIVDSIGNMAVIGYQFVSGFINGIINSATEVAQKIKNWFQNNVIDVAKKILGIASPSKVMAEIGVWAGKGLAMGLGSTNGEVVTQTQVLADAVTSIKTQIEELNKQYEVAYYAQGANSEAAKQLMEQIADLTKQYDNLTKAVGNAVEKQKESADLASTLRSIAGKATSDNASYSAELIKATMQNSGTDWTKINGGLGVGIPVASYAVGTNYVPNNQLAYLHKGEAVIPAKYNKPGLGGVVINIYDATDPDKVGRVVESKLKSLFNDAALGGAY